MSDEQLARVQARLDEEGRRRERRRAIKACKARREARHAELRERHGARHRSRRVALLMLTPGRRVPSRRAFERALDAYNERQGIVVNEGGRDTAWALVRVLVRRYSAQGQGFGCTVAQLSRGMQKRGRRRERRCIQLTLRRLEAMGIVHVEHVKLAGSTRRERDHLRVFLGSQLVAPSPAESSTTSRAAAPVPPASRAKGETDSAGYAGRERGPPATPAANGGDERGERVAQLALLLEQLGDDPFGALR